MSCFQHGHSKWIEHHHSGTEKLFLLRGCILRQRNQCFKPLKVQTLAYITNIVPEQGKLKVTFTLSEAVIKKRCLNKFPEKLQRRCRMDGTALISKTQVRIPSKVFFGEQNTRVYMGVMLLKDPKNKSYYWFVRYISQCGIDKSGAGVDE